LNCSDFPLFPNRGVAEPLGNGLLLTPGPGQYTRRVQATAGRRISCEGGGAASLSDNEVYAVTAYLLNLNGIIGENDEMNAQALPKVKMPNQASFIVVYPSRGK
jgi:hypothetical protein